MILLAVFDAVFLHKFSCDTATKYVNFLTIIPEDHPIIFYLLLFQFWHNVMYACLIMAFTYRDMGRTFHEYILCIFRNDWMDCRDNFNASLCLYCCAMDRT